MAARRRAVVVVIGAMVLALGPSAVAPASGAGDVVVDDWADLVALSFAGPATAVVTLVADVQSTGPNGLVVPPGGSWVLDLAGHALTIATSGGPAITVESQPTMASLAIRDTSGASIGLLDVAGGAGGAGIGGDYSRDAGTVTIESGSVTAVGGGGGAGIGGGAGGSGGAVTISGGSVTAIGSSYGGGQAAGIGNGALDATPGSLTLAGALLAGSAELAGTESCLPTPAFLAQPGRHTRVDVATSPDCSVTARVGAGVLPQLTTPTGLGVPRVGDPFEVLLVATGDPAPAFSVTGGALPPGLALQAATGRISGTPTTPGSFSATVTAVNQILGLAQTHSVPLTLTVVAAPPPTQDPVTPDGSGGPGGPGPGATDPTGGGPGSGGVPDSTGDGTGTGGGGQPGDGTDGTGPGGSAVTGGGTGGSAASGAGGSGSSSGGASVTGSSGKGGRHTGAATGRSSSGAHPWKAPDALGRTGSEPVPVLGVALALLLVGAAALRALVIARRRPQPLHIHPAPGSPTSNASPAAHPTREHPPA